MPADKSKPPKHSNSRSARPSVSSPLSSSPAWQAGLSVLGPTNGVGSIAPGMGMGIGMISVGIGNHARELEVKRNRGEWKAVALFCYPACRAHSVRRRSSFRCYNYHRRSIPALVLKLTD